MQGRVAPALGDGLHPGGGSGAARRGDIGDAAGGGLVEVSGRFHMCVCYAVRLDWGLPVCCVFLSMNFITEWKRPPGQGCDAACGLGLGTVSQNGQLLSRRGRSLPANASGVDTHRDSITSRLDCSPRDACALVPSQSFLQAVERCLWLGDGGARSDHAITTQRSGAPPSAQRCAAVDVSGDDDTADRCACETAGCDYVPADGPAACLTVQLLSPVPGL
jgi:hypothetical protein